MRKLASVQKIKDILPIIGADNIELALILGWQIVVKKNEFKIGDLVYFFEIDSWVPNKLAPFLSGDKEPREFQGVKGERLRTIKLRKQLSQGLVLPIPSGSPKSHYVEGNDVTEYLGVLKWEVEEKENTSKLPGSSQGRKFPSFIRKTDQERIQNYGALVEKCLDEDFEVTMKKDGSSMTVFVVNPDSPWYSDASTFSKGKKSFFSKLKDKLLNLFKEKTPIYGICSRNLMLNLNGESNFHQAEKASGIFKAMKCGDFDKRSLAIQGEVVAPSIQGNHEKVDSVEFHIFDIFDIDKQMYLLPVERLKFCKMFGLPHITVLEIGKLKDILKDKGEDVVKAALNYAEGDGDNKGVKREGVVFKSMTRDFSFKAISNSYLLKTGK